MFAAGSLPVRRRRWVHPVPTRLRALPSLPGQDSNPAPRIQSAVSYRIDDPGMVAGEPRTRRPVISAAPVGLPGQASAGCGIIHWGQSSSGFATAAATFPLVKYGSGSRNRTCVCTGIQSPVALASRAPRNGGAVGGHRPRFFGLEDRRVRQVHHDRMAFHLRRPYGARTRNLLAENQVSCQLAPTAHGAGGNRGREPTIAANVPSPGALGDFTPVRYQLRQEGMGAWRRRDSNPRPPVCRTGALPAELQPHGPGPGCRTPCLSLPKRAGQPSPSSRR